LIVVSDIAYVRYRAPDLEGMERFLLDFGLSRAARTESALYMRAAGSEPYAHITEPGESSQGIGFGLLTQSEADLERLAERCGARVRDNTEPRGGKIVTVTDPNGFRIDLLHGGKAATALQARRPLQLNTISEQRRLLERQRPEPGPSHVMRLGHVVLRVRSYRESLEFYSGLFGLRISDTYYAGTPDRTIMAFLHCGLGRRYTDHHTVAIAQIPGEGIEHSAFEVIDWDDVAIGHQHLASKGYRHSWGIGRHVEGSQVFDYWRDPFGNKVEHWTDGDLVNDEYVPQHHQFEPTALAQWAPPMSPEFLS
jgi:catechol 2,3-dioxygenase-like lactoylglutathione lyase family enzyme